MRCWKARSIAVCRAERCFLRTIWNSFHREALCELFDAQPFHPITHRTKRYSEQLGRGSAVVARLFQRLVDGGTLDAIEIVLQRPFVSRGQRGVTFFGWRCEMQIVGCNLERIGRQRQTSLENVF